MVYTYKYSSCHDNALQFGVYFEETKTATANNQIQCTYYPATELRDEFLIIDPDGNTDDYDGIIGLYNESTTASVFGNITGVNESTGLISVSSGISIGNSVTIKYYVHPKSYTTNFPSNRLTSSTSNRATKEILQCLLNKCQYMSPSNLFRLGYRHAHVLSRIHLDAGDAPWDDTSFVKVFDTNDESYYDYVVPHDYYFPMVITELRVYSDTGDIDIKVALKRGSSYDFDYFGEGTNDYIELDSGICSYKPGNLSAYLVSLRFGPVVTKSLQVKGRGDGSTLSGDIVIEASGYYMPLSGMGVL
jgi:hypothetical protein